MTVSNTNLRNDYEGNGTQTVFAFTFKVLNETNQETGKDFTIKVIITDSLGAETEQTEDVDYTVALSEDGTGNITFTTAPLLTESITFLSDIPRTQNTDYINIGTDKFPADSHEGTVDKLTLIAQEQDEAISRAVLLPESSQLTGLTIPVSVENADKAIVVNSAGDDLAAKNLADIGTAPVTDFAKTLLDDETAAEARATLEVKAAVDAWSNLGTASGVANTYTTTSSTVSGVKYIVQINATNTGASTLNGINIKKYDGAGSKVDVEAGDLQQDQYYDIFYDGTDIVVLNPEAPYLTATNISDATESAVGVVELATAAEIATGTDTSRVVTVANQSWVKISTATASSSSSIDFTDLSSTYLSYKVVIENMVPGTDGATLYLRTSTDNGSTYDSGASDYSWVNESTQLTTTPSSGSSGDNADAQISFQNGTGSDTNEKLDAIVDIINPSSTSYTTIFLKMMTINTAGNQFYQQGCGIRLSAADVDAIRFINSSGNIASGTFTLYGLKA